MNSSSKSLITHTVQNKQQLLQLYKNAIILQIFIFDNSQFVGLLTESMKAWGPKQLPNCLTALVIREFEGRR